MYNCNNCIGLGNVSTEDDVYGPMGDLPIFFFFLVLMYNSFLNTQQHTYYLI